MPHSVVEFLKNEGGFDESKHHWPSLAGQFNIGVVPGATTKNGKAAQAKWRRWLETSEGKSWASKKAEPLYGHPDNISEAAEITAKEQGEVDILRHLRVNQKIGILELSKKANATPEGIEIAIKKLQDDGLNVVVSNGWVQLSSTIEKRPSDKIAVSGKRIRFGLTSDNHLCSRYERLDILHALYDYFEREGISIVFNCGNMIDGEARFNTHDLNVHGFDNQVKYFIENFPARSGIETQFITGDDHEGWYTQKFGVDVGKRIQQDALLAGRTDLKYLGHMEHDVLIETEYGSIKIRLLHPGGGTGHKLSTAKNSGKLQPRRGTAHTLYWALPQG